MSNDRHLGWARDWGTRKPSSTPGWNDVFVLADYVDGNQSGLYQQYMYKLDSDGNFVWTRSVNDQTESNAPRCDGHEPDRQARVRRLGPRRRHYTWQRRPTTSRANPTGTTETAANVTLGLATFVAADASGSFGAPKGDLDGSTSGVVQSLACTYDPHQ